MLKTRNFLTKNTSWNQFLRDFFFKTVCFQKIFVKKVWKRISRFTIYCERANYCRNLTENFTYSKKSNLVKVSMCKSWWKLSPNLKEAKKKFLVSWISIFWESLSFSHGVCIKEIGTLKNDKKENTWIRLELKHFFFSPKYVATVKQFGPKNYTTYNCKRIFYE